MSSLGVQEGDDGQMQRTWIQRDFGLDKRLVKALSKMGFIYPTSVQAQCIPIALHGKDVLVRSRTGSGKTAAFGLPVLHKLLLSKSSGGAADSQHIRAVILAPTKELCRQIERHINDLMYYCKDQLSIFSLSDDNNSAVAYRLQARPDILVATPAKLVQQISADAVDLSHVEILVVDEADLVLSFGYAENVQTITTRMPKIFQGLLMSATLSPELEKFKRVVLHNPVVLKIAETQESGYLLQFYLECPQNDKYLILYVFIKLGLLQGKGLIFVNDVNKCYKLKLFLQQMFIPAAVLNSEVPLNSRLHILDEYNRGVFDYLIATDSSVDSGESNEDGNADGNDGNDLAADDSNSDKDKLEEDSKEVGEEEDQSEDNDSGEAENDEEQRASLKQRKTSSNKAANAVSNNTVSGGYGVSRGIDFQGVNFVINFDLPPTSAAYTHRIGRTARGGANGTALSFVSVAGISASSLDQEIADRDALVLHETRMQQPRLGSRDDSTHSGAAVLAAIGSVRVDDPALIGMGGDNQVDDESRRQPAPLIFNMRELDSFRYRVEETVRSVTLSAVQEFRAAEIKQEILNSAKLRSYFSENPDDLKVLRHDSSIAHPIKVKEHLRHVPSYLIPTSMRGAAATVNDKKKKKRKNTQTGSQDSKRQRSKQKDPLQSFDTGEAAMSQDAPVDVDDINGDSAVISKPAEKKIFTNTEAIGYSTSGRQKWKQSHKKGKFDPKQIKKQANGVPGAFQKFKGYK